MAIDLFDADEIVSRSNVNQRLTDIKNMFPVSIANGGTGETTATGIRTSLGIMYGTSLYDNSSGSTGTISLSQTIANFQFIEIFFWVTTSEDFRHSIRIYTGGSSNILTTATINIGGTVSGTTRRVRVVAGNMHISGTELTHTRDVRAVINGSTSFETADNTTDAATVYKVIGYKY